MEKIKNIQTEQIILNKHNTLLTQQRQHSRNTGTQTKRNHTQQKLRRTQSRNDTGKKNVCRNNW